MKKRCKRKVWSRIDPIALAIAGARPIDDEKLFRIRAMEIAAINAFQMGTATVKDWSSIADIANLAETMALDGVGPEVLPCCKGVEKALIEAKERFERWGRMGTSGVGLRAFVDLQEYHDLQRTAVSLSEYERAIQKTVNRVRSAHPSVKVLV